MKHTEVTELLADFAAQRLAPDEAAGAEAHLAQCRECRRWVETYRVFVEGLTECARVEDAEHPASALLARFVAERQDPEASSLHDLQAHLRACPECSREVELASAALDNARFARRPAAGVTARIGAVMESPASWAAAAAVVAAFIAGSLVGFLVRLPASPERTIARESLRGSQVIAAERVISASQVQVEEGANVTFRAGDLVALGDGFSVAPDAAFVVEIVAPPAERPRRADT